MDFDMKENISHRQLFSIFKFNDEMSVEYDKIIEDKLKEEIINYESAQLCKNSSQDNNDYISLFSYISNSNLTEIDHIIESFNFSISAFISSIFSNYELNFGDYNVCTNNIFIH
jgi:hypothetical protein